MRARELFFQNFGLRSVFWKQKRNPMATAGKVCRIPRSVGAIAIGDMNRDGTADIVIGYAAAPVSVFLNGGNGADFQQVRFGDAKGTVYGIAVGDLNKDEFLDIVLGLSDAPNKAYLSGL